MEKRLVFGARDFHFTDGSSEAWVIIVTHNRLHLSLQTIESLREHEPSVPILVVDNGSTDGTPEMLASKLSAGVIQKIILNSHPDVPQWQKSFSIAQALKILTLERPKWIVWLDDDMEVTRPFLENAKDLLHLLAPELVKVVILMDDEDQEDHHPSEKIVSIPIGGRTEEIKIRKTFNGAFNFFAAEFFEEFGYPPIGEGVNELGSEDWFYSRQMQLRGYRAAVFPAALHKGRFASKRMEIS